MSYTNYHSTYSRNKILLSPGTRVDSLFVPTATQQHALGRILEADDATGRMWRYCKNGGVALVQALTVSSEAPAATTLGFEVPQVGYDFADGDTRFDILLGTGHAYATHELIDGILFVSKSGTDGAVIGGMFIIKDNWIKTDDTVMTIEIADQDGLRLTTALTSDDNELSVIKSPYMDVVVTPTTQAAIVVGVPNVPVPINYYFWAQYRGPCAIISEDTVAIGNPVGYAATPTAGMCGPMGADTDPIYGSAMIDGADSEPSIVMLNLP